jgi:hypothetical protein
VKVNIADIEHRYREMTNDDLLAIAPRDLTQEARICYAKEAARRELAIEIPEEVPEQERQRVPVVTVDEDVSSHLRKALSRRVSWGAARSAVCPIQKKFRFSRQTVAVETLIPRAYRGRAPILWLRKFRPRSLGGYTFESFLFPACDCLGTPLTVQDGSYSYSKEASSGLIMSLIPGLIILPLLLFYYFPELVDDMVDDMRYMYGFCKLVIASGFVCLYSSMVRV